MNRDLLTLMGVTLHHDDCVARMRLMADASVDAIVTDPPYELGFMGKGWDKSGIANNPEMWREALRVLKPGGHLLAFSGTRTYHRMTCAIEDAGFEVRDQIGWLYGSGFPKSLDVSKAIDKAAGAERVKVLVPSKAGNSARRGEGDQGVTFGDSHGGFTDVSEPVTDAARQWQGWGTALKPAWEPICVARKPLIGTVADNVLAHGTGALNIDGCRVGDEIVKSHHTAMLSHGGQNARPWHQGHESTTHEHLGRWPANLIHDGSDEVLGAFPNAPGQQGRARTDGEAQGNNTYGALNHVTKQPNPRGDTGSAARFFYCAKASRSDRGDANIHPTVKPTDLMRYLCRLVTPPGGVVLDPFMGSGSTGKAAVLEGFQFVGIDMTAEYVTIAEARIAAALTQA